MKWIVFTVLILFYLGEILLSFLNRKYSMKPIPKTLKDIYDKVRYEKWLAYFLELENFKILHSGYNLLLILFLFIGIFPFLERTVLVWTSKPILQSLYFLGICQLILTIFNIPLKFYKTFSIEERHGFNKTSLKTFFRDILYEFLLVAVLGALLISVTNGLYLRLTDSLWLFVLLTWLFTSLVSLFLFTYLSEYFLRIFNKFTPLAEGTLKERIEELVASVNFNLKSISVMDASRRTGKLNAFFTGLGKSKEVVLFDTLLEKLSENEVMAVLAHELGHAVNKDTWRMFIWQCGQFLIYFSGLGLLLSSKLFLTSFGLMELNFALAIIILVVLIEPFSILLGLFANKMSRKAEYKADEYSARLTKAQWLISALKILTRENLGNLNPHPLYVKVYYTHPPLQERIRALR